MITLLKRHEIQTLLKRRPHSGRGCAEAFGKVMDDGESDLMAAIELPQEAQQTPDGRPLGSRRRGADGRGDPPADARTPSCPTCAAAIPASPRVHPRTSTNSSSCAPFWRLPVRRYPLAISVAIADSLAFVSPISSASTWGRPIVCTLR